MAVPITSDLAGYAAFWSRQTRLLVGVVLGLLAPIYYLLFKIWQAVR